MLFFSILYLFLMDYIYMFTDDVSVLCDKKQFSPFTHAPNRSVQYEETTSLNDRMLREGWYGTLDFIMPSVQPARRHCGAKYPMFLQSEPGLERTKVDVNVCINDCRAKMIIKAVKCSERLTVYKLKRPPISDTAYCLDGIESVLPDFHTTVTISTGLQSVPGDDKKQEFIFDCSFPDPNNGSLTYKATWFVDDVVVYESPYTDYNDTKNDRSLSDTRLSASNVTTVGFQLRCDIKAAIFTEGKRRFSLPSTSQQQFIGIKVRTPVINLQEGDTAYIRIMSSVPIGCIKNDGCELTVIADIPNEIEGICEPTPTANGGCHLLIRTKAWSSYSWFLLKITSAVTDFYGETWTQKKVFLRTDKLYLSQPIWQNYTLDPVTINIAKNTPLIEGRSCRSSSGSYLSDFTTTRSKIKLNGTFYLLILDNIEVQVQVTNCSGLGSGHCVCGVVVRVGRTIYLITRCNLDYWYFDYILYGEESDVLNVRREYERSFGMYLPRGTKIRVDLRDTSQYHWLDIYIYPFVRDIGKTSGLCGEITEDKSYAFSQYNNSHYNTWRVKNDVNLFDPDYWETLHDEREDIRFQYCRCDEVEDDKLATTLNCAPITGETTCSSDTDYTLHMSKMNQSLTCMQCVYCCLKHTVKDNSTNFLVIGMLVAVVVLLIVVISILAICLVRNKKGLVPTRSNVDSPTSTQDNAYDSISQPSAHIYEGLH